MSIDPSELDTNDPRGLRDAVERSVREAAEARAELQQLKTREAFRDAGLDPSNKLHQALIKGYDGDLDGVKGYVEELGVSVNTRPTQAPLTNEEIDPVEQQAMARVSSLASGDGGGLAPNQDAEGDDRLRDLVKRARAEGWQENRFNDEMVAEMQRQGRPVTRFEGIQPAGGVIRSH